MNQESICTRICILSMTIFIWLGIHGVAVAQGTPVQPFAAAMSERLRIRIEALERTPTMSIQGEIIRVPDALVRFYIRRGFQAVWICEDGLLPYVDTLLRAISQAEREGIRAGQRHLARISQLTEQLKLGDQPASSRRLSAWVDAELLLTDAFFNYGSQILTGQIDPRELHEGWFADRPRVDLESILLQVAESNRLEEFLQHLRPPHTGYAALKKALAVYHDISARGGWPVVAEGPKLQKGDRGPRVAALRDRLLMTADLDRASAPMDDLFDDALERGLQRFQQRHGIDADGVVGAATSTALNVPVETRMRQIELNMERWRWVPQDLGERYILVNIANFALDVVERGRSVLAMRVIVGKPARRTPFFSAEMTYLVLSPHWYVPPTIAIQDKLPLIRRDPGYVARQQFKLFRDGEGGGIRVNPMSVDWSSVNARNFPYRLRQDPGPRNALGGVKFMLPNPHHVYLHDTPSRELFAKTERAFSSGCIRLEKPIELAEYLLRDDPKWSRQKIHAAMGKRTEQVVHLPTSIPVHLLYWTAWVSDEGVMHFRKDLYERDVVLDKALRNVSPSRSAASKVDLALQSR